MFERAESHPPVNNRFNSYVRTVSRFFFANNLAISARLGQTVARPPVPTPHSQVPFLFLTRSWPAQEQAVGPRPLRKAFSAQVVNPPGFPLGWRRPRSSAAALRPRQAFVSLPR